MDALLAWTLARSFAEAAALSLAVNVVVFVAALAVGSVMIRAFPAPRVAKPPPPLAREEIGFATACVVLNAVVMFVGWALFRAGILTVSGSGAIGRWLVDAILLVVVMDLAMYLTHRAAHLPPFYRLVHGIHHRYDQPRPLTLFVLHPIEVLGFGGLWIGVLCTHTFSLGGMLLYLTINTVFGVVGHVGVEPLPKAWARWPLLRRIGTSTFHARHHQEPTTNFGFYTTIWDRLFRTLGTDYASRFGAPPRHLATKSDE